MFTIGIFGRRNVGKSSLINALTEQNLAIVSDIAGTTTDPVKKSIELSHIGKSVIIDTAGFDDDSELGKQRIEKTKQVLQTIDFAILVFSENQFGSHENEWIENFQTFDVPFIIVHNKCDLEPVGANNYLPLHHTVIDVSVKEKINLQAIFDEIVSSFPRKRESHSKGVAEQVRNDGLVADLISPNDIVILVTPIDSEAPVGRLILPQVQTIRAILDENAIAITCKTEQLQQTLNTLKTPPALVITDSQAFAEVEAIVPKDCNLTSFSILLARQKGDFSTYLKGTPHIGKLNDGDKILILESCTHQSTCENIARVKLPNLLKKQTGKTLQFDIISGLSPLPDDWETYAMVFQCGACMITQKQLHNRLKPFIDKGIPVSNFGMAFAYLNGIFERAVSSLRA
ncbi:MAG: [FeFe] hydrogenase H-cluster maturation GTPase HydF [Bacteroidales bacterium]|nr:[FeFe] hydrogenase H-cluster maturation GTPase HydF [Bacteroidales bacterium]